VIGAAAATPAGRRTRRKWGSSPSNREVTTTPGEEKEHVKGVGDKEQRMYEPIKEEHVESGRYGGRAGEVAARTVTKHHEREHHKKGE